MVQLFLNSTDAICTVLNKSVISLHIIEFNQFQHRKTNLFEQVWFTASLQPSSLPSPGNRIPRANGQRS